MTYNYIQTQEELAALTESFNLEKPNFLAVDIEGESNRHRYGFRMCLIQLYDGKIFHLIDTVKITDLSPLRPILENPEIRKIMYATDFDVRLFFHIEGYRIRGIFDIQIAAKALEFENITLPWIIQHFLEVTFVKNSKLQSSDWNKRPLTETLLQYALNDVRYLPELYDKISVELAKRNLTKEVEERCIGAEEFTFKISEEPWKDIKTYYRQLPEVRDRIYSFWKVRDQIARKLDYPPYWVALDARLVEWAQHPPQNWDDLKGIAGRVKPFMREFEKVAQVLK